MTVRALVIVLALYGVACSGQSRRDKDVVDIVMRTGMGGRVGQSVTELQRDPDNRVSWRVEYAGIDQAQVHLLCDLRAGYTTLHLDSFFLVDLRRMKALWSSGDRCW